MYAHHGHPSYNHSSTPEQRSANDLLAHRSTVRRLRGEIKRLRDTDQWDQAQTQQVDLDAVLQAERDDADQQSEADRNHDAMLARWATEA